MGVGEVSVGGHCQEGLEDPTLGFLAPGIPHFFLVLICVQGPSGLPSEWVLLWGGQYACLFC